MELIKNTIRVGNSAGVLLPKEFLNTQVKIVLQPLNIEKDILDILMEEKMLKKFKTIIFLFVFFTLYFNIGWGLGYYYHYNNAIKTFESASWHAKLLGGHCFLFPDNEKQVEKSKKDGPLFLEIFLSIIWPFILLCSLVSWLGHIAFWILKFCCWGGLVRLIFGIP